MKRSEGLYMLPYAFNMRNSRLYQGWKVLEYSLEGETSWMSVHLIRYSRGRLCDCQHSTGRKERDNGEKPKSALAFLPCTPTPTHPRTAFSPPTNSLCHVALYELWHFSSQWWNHCEETEGRPVECIHTKFPARPDTSNLPESQY